MSPSWTRARPSSLGARLGLGLALVLALAGLFGWTRLRGAGAEPAETQEAPFTLFLLGGSTALGEPYDPRADIGRIVDWLLAGEVGGLPLRVVNMADAGKASAAVVDDARRIADEPPPRGTAVALLYLGNNEFLRFDDEHDLTRNTRALFDEPTLPPVARATVLETYGRNIERIVDALEQAGVGVIASSVAVNEKDWEPNRSVLGDPSHGPELKRLLAEGEREGAEGRHEAALAAYLRVLELEPRFALASKRAGDCLRALGRPAEARARYQDAIDHDGNPYRETSEQTRLLREVCARRGVPVVDSAARLEGASPEGLIGYELMWDNCHPTLEGYARIAEGFVDVLVERYGARRARAELDVPALEQHLGFDDAFRSRVLATRGQYCYVSSELIFDPRARLARADEYLARAQALTPDDADLHCSRAVWEALTGDVEGSLSEWRRALALDPRVTRQRARLPQVQQVMTRAGVELSSFLRSAR